MDGRPQLNRYQYILNTEARYAPGTPHRYLRYGVEGYTDRTEHPRYEHPPYTVTGRSTGPPVAPEVEGIIPFSGTIMHVIYLS